MFWQLLLAHFLADYPLQPRWLVFAKQHLWGLVLHTSIHFLTALLLVGDARWAVLPQLVALAVVHFLIDLTKYRLAVRVPDWVTLPYFFDQLAHLLTLLLVARWIGSVGVQAAPQPWMIYALGYLLATHVWFVTERMLTWSDKAYLQALDASLWPRMLARAAMLTVLLLIGIGPSLAAVTWMPYGRQQRGGRALLIDLAVAVGAAVLLRWIARAALGT